MNDICIIVGAGDMSGTKLYVPDGAFVIAADGGLGYLKKANVSPNLIMGDFDSLGYVPSGENVFVSDSEKNDTDTLLAVRKALSLGSDTIVIYGGMGARFDHSFANIQTLKHIADNGAHGYLIGCGYICTVIKSSGICFDASHSGYVSVFSVDNQTTGVNLKGLKYPLTDAILTNDYPLGVSNEFMGLPSSVSVRDGCVLVIWRGDSFIPGKYELIRKV